MHLTVHQRFCKEVRSLLDPVLYESRYDLQTRLCSAGEPVWDIIRLVSIKRSVGLVL